jgi:hypothetical protein
MSSQDSQVSRADNTPPWLQVQCGFNYNLAYLEVKFHHIDIY